MSFLYRYVLILLACIGLLLGIQIPSFVDQFDKRLDAHFQEAQANLKGYREIADREFGGSMEALIQRHQASTDPVFHDEAGAIDTIYSRYRRFKDQRSGLQTSLPGQVWYLVQHGDRELLRETYDNYTYALALDSTAIYSGFALVGIVLLLTEFTTGLIGLVTGLGSSRRSTRF